MTGYRSRCDTRTERSSRLSLVGLDRANSMKGCCFLATFRPLIRTARGRAAAQNRGLPLFIDGSCRREPDFESRFPSISATCRAGQWAPRLQEGDRVAYLTCKHKYPGDEVSGWRLVAVLRVVKRFPHHREAARWYRGKGCLVPSNCLADGNPPKALELTNGDPPRGVKKLITANSDPRAIIRLWDCTYRRRVGKWPVFLATNVEFLDLTHPLQLTEADFVRIFGRVPGMLNPPQTKCDRLERLLELATGRILPRTVA